MTSDDTEGEVNLVAFWLRKDPTRWVAGAIAGLFAGVVAMVFGMILSMIAGYEIWFPIKAMATPVLGNSAMTLGFHIGSILIGFLVQEVIFGLFGFAFGHFVFTNHAPSLLAMGAVWGTFAWIFICNLYLRSFMDFRWLQIPSAAMFFYVLVWGLALTSIMFFDRAMRPTRR